MGAEPAIRFARQAERDDVGEPLVLEPRQRPVELAGEEGARGGQGLATGDPLAPVARHRDVEYPVDDREPQEQDTDGEEKTSSVSLHSRHAR